MKNNMIGYAITIGLAAVAGISSYYGAINAQSASIAEVNTQVQVLKFSDANQNTTISEMKGSVEYIRRVVEEQARRQGIVIKDDNKIIYDPYITR